MSRVNLGHGVQPGARMRRYAAYTLPGCSSSRKVADAEQARRGRKLQFHSAAEMLLRLLVGVIQYPLLRAWAVRRRSGPVNSAAGLGHSKTSKHVCLSAQSSFRTADGAGSGRGVQNRKGDRTLRSEREVSPNDTSLERFSGKAVVALFASDPTGPVSKPGRVCRLSSLRNRHLTPYTPSRPLRPPWRRR